MKHLHIHLRVLLLLLCLSLTAACFAACGGGEGETTAPSGNTGNNAAGYSIPIAGSYNFFADDGDRALRIEADGYAAMTIDGVLCSGICRPASESKENKKYSFTFQSGSGEMVYTAVYEDGVLKLTEKAGGELRFLPAKSFTVSFDSLGGSAVAPLKVQNGDTAASPTPPTRKGYTFIGWCRDDQCTDPYSFSNAVTQDLKLYALWAPLSGSESVYSVTLDACGGTCDRSVLSTVGGRLYALPTPTREGYTFAGWWYSMQEDAARPSFAVKSGETVFLESTTLYARWIKNGEDALIVHVGKTDISWNSLPSVLNYTLTVTDEKGNRLIDGDTGATLTRPVDFANAPAGNYVIEVTAGGKTGMAYYQNHALPRVSDFEIIHDKYLSFGAVEGAERYIISVECGDAGHDHREMDLGKSTSFLFADCPMKEGGIVFTVSAVAEGKLTSTRTYIYNRQLEPVTDLLYDESTELLTWKSVKNAMSYQIKIGNTVIDNGNKTSFSLKSYAAVNGRVTVSVTPVTAGYNSPQATVLECKKDRLSAPTGIRIEGDSIVWDAVTGAASYTVSINGRESTVAENKFTPEGLTAGEAYRITVRTNGEKSSLPSDPVTAVYRGTPRALRYENGRLVWDPILGMGDVEICVNQGEILRLTPKDHSVPVKLIPGKNTLSVRPAGGGEWVSITVRAYTVSFDTRGGTAVTSLTVAYGEAIDPALFGTSDKKFYHFGGWYTAPGENAAQVTKGRYETLGDTVYYAHWIPKSYDVTLSPGESGTLETASVRVTYGSSFRLPVPLPKDGYTFIGWYTLPGQGGEQVTDESGNSLSAWNSEGRTLYAAWINRALVFIETTTAGGGEKVYAVEKGKEIGELTELTIPATHNGLPVAYIYSGAFMDCANLEVINIPDTIRVIGSSAGDTTAGGPFAYCRNLRAVNIYSTGSTAAHRYFSDEGVLFDRNEQTGRLTLSYYPAARSGAYTVPTGVEVIPMRAFAGTKIASVTLPSSVISIGDNAFYNCKLLSEVIFLSSASKPGTTVVGESAFRDCTALSTVTLPQYTRLTLGEADGPYDARLFTNIFYGCSSLASIKMAGEGNDYSVSDGILLNRAGNTLIYYPTGKIPGETLLPSRVTAIGDYAFAGHMKLSAITLPYTVTTVGAHAFEESTVSKVTFGGDAYFASPVKIGDYAFSACVKLQHVNLAPDSRVTAIGKSAFAGSALTRFGLTPTEGSSTVSILPRTITSLDTHAFAGTLLKDVTFETGGTAFLLGDGVFSDCIRLSSVKLPVCIESFNSTAFTGCIALTDIGFVESTGKFTAENDAIYEKNANGWTLVYYSGSAPRFTVKSGTTEIAADVFRGNIHLCHVTIPSDISYIGAYAFADCPSLNGVTFEGAPASLRFGEYTFQNSAITAFACPLSVTDIPEGMFENARQLATLSLHDGILSIGENGFRNTALTAFSAPTGLSEIPDNAFEGVRTLVDLTLCNVTSIGDYAFKGCGIKALTVSAEVLEIGVGAFDGSALETLQFTLGGAAPLTLGREAFRATLLTSVLLPSRITSLPANVFAATGVQTVAFENNAVTASDFTIDPMAFDGLSLGALILPEGLGVIAEGTFAGSPLSAVTIPKSVTVIEYGAFADAARLASVVFQDGGTSLRIEACAFAGCASLTALSLPAHLTDIQNIFADDESITTGVVNHLTSLTVAAQNAVYTAENNVLYAGTTAILSAAHAEGLTIRENTTVIAPGAFAGAKLGNVMLPTSLTDIGDYAFAYSSIEDPVIPASVLRFGAYAFYFAESLGAVTFEGTPRLCAMGEHVFESSGLSLIALPGSLASLPAYAFARTAAAVDFSDATGIKVIPAYAFYGTGLSEFVIPEGITTVEGGAFAGSALRRVTIASTVTHLNTVYDFGAWGSVGAFTDSVYLSEILFAIPSDGVGEDLYIGVAGEYDPYGGHVGGSFEGCTSLTSLVIPARTVYIGQNSFYAPKSDPVDWSYICNSLTSITFEAGSRLHTVEAGAFAYAGVTELILPDGIAVLSSGADAYGNVTGPFSGCANLQAITLSASVTAVDFTLFAGCTALSDIKISDASETYTTQDGVLFDKSMETLLYYPTGKTEQSYTLPESVTAIGSYAFNHTVITLFPYVEYGAASLEIPEALTSVTLPADLCRVGDAAFAYLHLEDINLASAALEDIGAYAFYRTSLSEVSFQASLSTLGEFAFAGCTALHKVTFEGTSLKEIAPYAFSESGLQEISIPRGVETVGAGAFADCQSLVQAILPDSITQMAYDYEGDHVAWYGDRGVFEGCVLLQEVTLPENEGFRALAPATFKGCTKLESIALPDSIFEILTDNGAASPFAGCTSLAAVALPTRLGAIEDGLFAGCSALITVELPLSVALIGDHAFAGCTSLETIEIPAAVQSIGASAFDGCTALHTATLKDGIKTVGDYAFRDCKELQELLLVGSVEHIGSGIFTGCRKLVVRLDYSNASYVQESEGGVLLDLNQTEMLYVPSNFAGEFIVPDTITSIGASTFAYSDFTKIVLPAGLKVIPEKLFAGSTNLREVVMPESITSIQASAFEGCTGLERITIGREVTSIGNDAFRGCTSLKTLTFTEGGKNAMTIGRSAFEGCTSLVSSTEGGNTLVLPGRLRTILGESDDMLYLNQDAIGMDAFKGCIALQNVVIGETVSVGGSFSIGMSAFADCTSLASVSFPGNLGLYTADGRPDSFNDPCIGREAFRGCVKLSEILFAAAPSSDHTFTLTEECFAGVGVEGEGIHLVLPSNLRFHDSRSGYRADSIFEGANILSVTVTGNSWDPTGRVAQDVFKNCTALAEVVFCEGVTSIGAFAFQNCTALQSVTFPTTLSHLDGNPFIGCKNVKFDALAENGNFAYVDGILYDPDMTVLFLSVNASGRVVIPESVRTIASGAFYGCSGVTAILLHEKLTEIGDYAFAGTGITAMDLSMLPAFGEENYDGFMMIGDGWFQNCVRLTSVKTFAAMGIGAEAFAGCRALTYYDFSAVEDIGYRAFANSGLTFAKQNQNGTYSALITLSAKNIWSIAEEAFLGCQGPIFVDCRKNQRPDRDSWMQTWNGDCDVAYTDGILDADRV